MTDGLNAAEGLELLFGADAIGALGGRQVAVDELDGLGQAAGRLGLPDFAKAAAAEAFQEPIAGDGLGVFFNPHRHECLPCMVGRLLPFFPKRERGLASETAEWGEDPAEIT